ncbi:hypothetical protein B0H13DRAFT_2040407, partial [Mycena leptocephala]
MLLNHLNTDVLLQIFALTDVSTIMSLSRVRILCVNKSFHEITSFKQLWLSIVRDLSRARVIDAPAEETLETLSTAELVEEVRRAVVGPRTWSPASSVPPTVHRQFSIPWNVGRVNYDVFHAATDFQAGTSKVRLAILYLLDGGGYDHGSSEELLHLPVNFVTWWNPQTPQLCGDFFACEVVPGISRFIMLLNWRTAECIAIDSQRISFCALFPFDFLILENLQLYSISSLDGLWGPIETIAANIRPNLRDIPSVTCSVPRHNDNIKVDSIAISVTANPLHAATYDCVVEVTNMIIRPPILHPTSLLKRLRNKFIRKPPPVPDIPKTVYCYSIFFQLKSILHCPETRTSRSTEVHRLAEAGKTTPPIIIPEPDPPLY